jgi:outer membrane protein assembly factor BamB
MKKLKNKITAIAIAIFFVLSLAASVTNNLTTSAHKPPFTIPTFAYISVQPNPVGVGQQASVNFWIDQVPPTANQAWGDRWENYMVKVTHPDGTVENLGPFESDAAGGAHTWYTPSTLGNYTFVFSFPGQTLAGYNLGPGFTNASYPNVGDYYSPSTSVPYVLTVQEEQSPLLPTNPLPTGYWQRPIFANNLAWYTISGNWLGGGTGGNAGCTYNSTSNFVPYSKAPNTAHIVWTRPYAPGGLIGGEFGGNQVNSNFYSTAQYECKFAGVVINGVLYRTLEPGSLTSYMGWEAINLRTGEQIWYRNQSATTWLRMGQVYSYVSPNQYGGLAYLWSTEATVAPNTGSTFGMYDAMTGGWILSVVNATSPTWAYGPSGELLGYYINSTSKTLNMWNSSKCILVGQTPQQVAVSTETNWLWRPRQGAQIDFKLGIEWTKPLKTTMTADNGTTVDIDAYYAEAAGTTAYPMAITRVSDIVLVDNSGAGGRFMQPGYIVQTAYNPETGDLLWGPTKQTIGQPWSRTSISSMGQGVYTILTYETQTISAYKTTTGQKIWGPVSVATPNNPWGYYICASIIGYDKLFVVDFGGNVWCLNLATGAVIWKTSTNEVSTKGVAGANTPYGVWTIANILCLADGKLFTMGGHLYSPPLYNGGQIIVFNATTGEMVWNDLSFAITNSANGVLSDGYLVVPNAYDNRLYCYSKGQSATTVSAPDVAVPMGTSILIKGTVTDQSPGDTCLGIPAAGTPAISDASMTSWMEYLYQQQPMPTNASGVPVSIDVLDSNGNYRNIGTTTSDISGTFGFLWKPDIPGKYTVIATFAGSESYYPSYSETSFAVDLAASASPYPVVSLPPTEMYFAASTIAIIIAIAIVGILMLRKRP